MNTSALFNYFALLKWFFLCMAFVAFSCTQPKKEIHSFPAPDKNYKNLGDEINRDARALYRLFDLPSNWYRNSPKELSKITSRAWLGIVMKLPDFPVQDPEFGETLSAIEVKKVFPESAADLGGLEKGDFIVALDGKKLFSDKNSVMAKFRQSIQNIQAGSIIRIKIIRQYEEITMKIRLQPRPKAPANPKSHPNLEREHGRVSDSLLLYLLEKEHLVADYRDVAASIRDTTRWINSPYLKKSRYNPFRLSEVDYVMHYPFDLAAVASEMTSDFNRAFNPETKNLAELLRKSMESLDITPPYVNHFGPQNHLDLTGYIDRMVKAITWAKHERELAFAALDADELDLLVDWAQGMLKEELDKSQDETGKASSKAEANQQEMLHFFENTLKIDWDRLLVGGLRVAEAVDLEMLQQFQESGPILDRFGTGWVVKEEANLTVIRTRIGDVFIGGTGDNVYTEEAVLIIDLGGNDRYENKAGGSSIEFPFSVVIDFSGDDHYISREEYVQGAGLLGAGFLIDLSGNDRYFAGNFAQGVGFFGVGVLIDTDGFDAYQANAFAQGAGAFGIGWVAESGGNDRYAAARFAQGFGFVKGFGAIIETSGSDQYFAGGKYPDFRDPEKSYISLSQGFGFGSRPGEEFIGASGGIGIITDAEGNDTYIGDYFAQGASYWYALGILSDQQGHDTYVAGRYSQGAGTHLTAGLLIDNEGDDLYLAKFGVAQGCGHDYAIGMLIDNGGNDRYIGGVIAQGAGNDNGFGVLNDNGGNDEYYIRGLGHGRGNFQRQRHLPSFGIHFDTGGGEDLYHPNGKNNRLIFKTDWGIFADTD